MPAVFPAAADVRQCVAAAAGQPRASQWTHVARQLRGPESAVPSSNTGPGPSEFRCASRKYGTRLPSAEVLKCCVTTRSSASKNAGEDLISHTPPVGVPCSSCGGLSKPVAVMNISSLSGSKAASPTVAFSGTPLRGSNVQAPGVTTSTTVATSRSIRLKNRSPANTPAARNSSPSGSNTTRGSAVPARSCS